MKKIKRFFTAFISLVFLTTQLYAVPFVGNDYSDDVLDVTEFDESSVLDQFTEIEELSQLISVSDELTISDFEGSNLIENISSETMLPVSQEETTGGEDPLGIPSFLWGCVFGVIGILIVYVVSENTEQTKQAVTGCAVSSAISTLIYVIAVASVSTTTTY